ncbi:fumarylacetoacetate hydrolase family protein [Pseudonocardia alni]|uniref:2-keto-4-pentenoate hydratase/2-oxohepta-3-ene-1,7-dioic acid hydratase in catechol pathway n=1 Tax=Pseudonocardia alni TaxID=33907 RepID=A0A852WDW6_PSEA5|nr:fumarylacetoacetate hydrolase family protein [Pseudonocardia antarctica]NYG04904.1 2-keto-4-pentenoate hydratase/2-oxohepta-3-ene-1,7-dioic acid hydratase in catechol pathway [Pseudonocardia antarctica]
MKWVTYEAGAGERTGILDGETVRGLAPGTTLAGLLAAGALVEAGDDARRAPTEVLGTDDVRLLAPLPRPVSIRDGLCFLDHLRGCHRALGRDESLHPAWSENPGFYFANADAIVGPYDDVPVAPGSTMFDLELEVAAVVGTGGRDLDPRRAEEHIVGYTFYNDWTARDHQLRDMAQGIGMGKSKDSAITLGPALVTVDELEPFRRDGRLAFEVSASVGDRELTRGSLATMDWTFGELLAYVSRGADLTPGAVVGSGTVPGGCLLEHVDTPDLAAFTGWLQPGDVVSLRGEGLGETRQTVRPARPVIPLRDGA